MPSNEFTVGSGEDRPSVRSRVIERRLTRQVGELTVRFWIETDPAYGGVVGVGEAIDLVNKAVESYAGMTSRWHTFEVAEHFLNSIPCANSVEACDEYGHGFAIHKDWP